MHRQIRAAALFLLLGSPVGLHAGFVKYWQLREIEQAPVLVSGRIVSVEQKDLAPAGTVPWNAETWRMIAGVEVLRSYGRLREPIAAGRVIQVGFLKYGSSVKAFINGSPPPLPQFIVGQTVVLPLKENDAPASESWRLTDDSGTGLAIPVRGEMSANLEALDARAFLCREIANTLGRGTPEEVSAMATYLGTQTENVTPQVTPLLEQAISGDSHRRAEVVSNLLAAAGDPQPSVAELRESRPVPSFRHGATVLTLAASMLPKFNSSAEADDLLIHALIAEAPWHAPGSAAALLQYAEAPAAIEALREALAQDVSGSSYIAWRFAQAGHHAIVPDALRQALKLADHPSGERPDDIQGAGQLLRDFGDDAQLKQLAGYVLKYQTTQRAFYNLLWQSASGAGNPREARVLGVVLRDRRSLGGERRVCDYALGVLEKALNENFGARGTLKERDEALDRAVEWLRGRALLD